MRVFLAMEPRSYREVIGQAIGALRPHVEVEIVEPEDLSEAVARLEPELVFADSPPSDGRSAWVVFRSDEKPLARVRFAGRWRELEEVQLLNLLELVDEAEQFARTTGELGDR